MKVRVWYLVFLALLAFPAQTLTHAQATSRQPENQSATPSSQGSYDGPAELPRNYVESSLRATPAPGKILTVRAGEDPSQALSKASCGDTVQLQAGATFGMLRLPEKKCDDSHWIIIRTDANDLSLPPEGTRLTPCYAGVSSLAGRPPLNCASTANVLAKIEFNGKGGSGPILLSPGANHYRLIGLEVTRAASSAAVYNLVQLNGPADHLVFDRMWIHGTPHDETVRGILLGPSRYVAIVDSFFTDFHCVGKTGSCVDSQAIAGGLGDDPMGPYKIVNNFLEAAAENILFGGGRATMTPQDIEIRHNYMLKPLTWMKGQPGFVGGTDGGLFIVKNLFELKNAQRVLFEGNLLENSWGGFSQAGFGILITPKNQAGANGANVCPECQTTDITIRFCKISHIASGMVLANGLSDNGGAARDGQRYSIHDVIIDDIEGKSLGGSGNLFQVSMGREAPKLQNIRIDHITAFPPNGLLNIGDDVTNPKMSNLVFTNNIVMAGEGGVSSTGGGPRNCAFPQRGRSPTSVLASCFDNIAFSHNAVIQADSGWPKDNFFPKKPSDVGFVHFNNGAAGDYRLSSSSRFAKAGSDGRDLGADVNAVQTALTGVE